MTLGAEYPVTLPDPAPSHQGGISASCACSGSICLSAWVEFRYPLYSVHAARFDPSGKVLDPAGLTLASDLDQSPHPAVASNGAGFYVAWEGRSVYGIGLHAAVVDDATGLVTPAPGFGLAQGGGNAHTPTVVWTGSEYLVVWSDSGYGFTDLHLQRLGASGQLITPEIPIVAGPGHETTPSAIFSGGRLALAWSDDGSCCANAIFGGLFLPNGSPLLAGPVQLSSGPPGNRFAPRIAAGATSALVVWGLIGDVRPSEVDIQAIRWDPATALVLDPAPIEVTNALRYQLEPAVAWDGSNFLVAWRDDRDTSASHVYAGRVSAGGIRLDGDGLMMSPASGMQYSPALSVSASGPCLLWSDSRVESLGIVASEPGTAGGLSPGVPFSVSLRPHIQFNPAVASGDLVDLAAWLDRSAGYWQIMAARVDRSGVSLDPMGLPVSGGPLQTYNTSMQPAVAYAAGRFLVTWSTLVPTRLMSATVSEDGQLTAPTDITPDVFTQAVINDPQPAAAADGRDFLVVSRWNRGGQAGEDIFATRVSGKGKLLGKKGIHVIAAGSDQTAPRLSWDGKNYLVACQSAGTPGYSVLARQINRKGKSKKPLSGFQVSPAGTSAKAPSVSCAPGECLVAWQSYEPSSGPGIRAARVKGGDSVLDPAGILLNDSPGDQLRPAVAWTGSHWFVAWEDAAPFPPGNISGLRVTTDGTMPPEDYPFIALSLPPDGRYLPVLTPGGAGRALLAFYGFDFSPDYQSERVFLRELLDP